MPLPQSFPAGRGIADTLQTSIATMNNDAFIGYVYWLCVLCIVLFLLPIYYFYSCMHECTNKKEFNVQRRRDRTILNLWQRLSRHLWYPVRHLRPVVVLYVRFDLRTQLSL